ncbi:hypothetical protein FRB90_011982 [Tulasnella sp. 427]|nr:hypothetical protein FRB90_011982 [Tulasnella sp. 427]
MSQTPNAGAGTPRATNPPSLALPTQPAAGTSAPAATAGSQAANTTSYFTATPNYPPTAHAYYQYATAAAAATPYRTNPQTPAYPAYPATPMTATATGATAGAGPATPAYYPYGQAFNAAMYSGYLNSPALGGTGTTSTYPYGPIQTPTAATPAPAATTAVPSLQVNQPVRAATSLVLPGAAATPVTPAVQPPLPALTTVLAAAAAQHAPAPAVTTAARGPGRKPTTFKGAFVKDLRNMMYGFGDDPNPAPDTVNVMEEILMEFIADVCATSLKTSRKHTIKLEDLRRALSRPADSKKLARMEELLFMQEDIKRARAQFDPADESVAKEMIPEEDVGEEDVKPGKGKEKLKS